MPKVKSDSLLSDDETFPLSESVRLLESPEDSCGFTVEDEDRSGFYIMIIIRII